MLLAAIATTALIAWKIAGPGKKAERTAVSGPPARLSPAPNGPPQPALAATDAGQSGKTDELARRNRDFAAELDALLTGTWRGMFPKFGDVVARWVAVDPVAALSYVEKLGPDPRVSSLRHALGGSGMRVWVKQDPAAAIAYTKEAVWRDAANVTYLESVFPALLRPGSPEPYAELKAYLDQLPRIEAVQQAIQAEIILHIRDDIPAAESFIEQLPAEFVGERLYFGLGLAKAQVAGWTFVETLTRGQLPAGTDRNQLSGALATLYEKTPGKVATWLEKQPRDGMFDFVRGRIAADALERDPQEALRLAQSLSREEARLSDSGDYLGYWLRKDYAAAEAWAIGSELPTQLVAEKIAQAQTAKIPVDYASKLTPTLEIADPKLRHRAQWSPIEGWLRQDRAVAIKWMEANTRTEDDRRFFEGRKKGIVPEPEKPSP